ncbi:ROP-interactive CRIB motif-containing protein 7 [Perilla frutescens var. hirtella]|uniref:ROP-interactive CRIB motif-containing protein 7 n=1 Tax=Perilla frutescens var. hirtella TaxID=608512 RepID=A0AAD4ILY5_PERFH|nr:ROP-interactive CRIB motif-containing protein 7 [Perilla frutescens var. hirtella]
MAQLSFYMNITLFSILATFMPSLVISQSPPPLDPAEQEAVYRIMESVNSDIPWRTLFPDDICSSAPHGVVCDYFSDAAIPHITELSFGYVSDYSPNPPCNPNSTLNPSLLSPLSHLTKLFFYKCFGHSKAETPFPYFSALNQSSSLEELVFIENPGLTGSLEGRIGNLRRLRRLVLTGTSVSGSIPDDFGEFVNLEQLTLSRNKFEGEISMNIFHNMKKLKVLDLSDNGFEGNVPESMGYSTELLKIDLSYNKFSGKIPESFKDLKNVEFLDLSYNNFGSFGFPLVLAEMPSLKEVYLSGNFLGGEIPDIWGNLRGIMGIGMSRMGLVGNIPKSMGVHLRNACYIGLDNNMLEGVVPQEIGDLELVRELNLENNNLSGRVPFSASFLSKLGGKLKLEGNLDLCIDEGLKSAKVSVNLGHLKVCRQPYVSKTALFHESSSPIHDLPTLAFMVVGVFYFGGVLAEIVV